MPAADRLLRLPAIAASAAVGLAVAAVGAADDPPVPPPRVFPAPPAAAEPEAAGEAPSLFATDRVAARRLRLAEERIAAGVFDDAVDLLQAVLDAEEDAAAPADEDAGTFRSLKGRALDLLAGLPPDGKRIYELKYGVAARKRLEEALASGDWEAVEAVSRAFFHTAAGHEATYRLAVRAQDRGEPLHAAVLFERLADSDAARFEPQLSLRSAAAWAQAGLRGPAREAAGRYLERAKRPAGLGGAPFPQAADPDALLAALERDRGAVAAEPGPAWPVFGREPDRTAEVDPVTVAGGAAWSHRLHAASEWDVPRRAADAAKLAATLELVTAVAGETGELTQPASHPIVAGDAAVFRTLRGIEAVDLSTGRFLWRTERPHDVVFDRALDGINLFLRAGNPFGNDVGRTTLLEEYVAQYAWRNLTSGTLSTDGKYVYGVEGVGIVGGSANVSRGGPREQPAGSEPFNTLFAYELAAEGRIAWAAGGPPKQEGTTGLFFLGPPLPLGGRLYALAEEDGEIRLVVLDPAAGGDDGRVLWSQALVATEAPVAANPPLFADPLRKLSGLSPSFADGVLVCPTGAGAVVGVDLGRRLLLWGYQYPRNVVTRTGPGRGVPMMMTPPVAPDDETDRWLDAVPRVADGAVYLTPRDSDELHCVDLRDGRLRWKRPRGAMLYLAAAGDGKAVLVGRREVAALDADTGEPAWSQSLGTTEPAGRGVRSGDLYHLPLASGEILTLRLSTGQILARSPVGDGLEAGNLIAVGGRLVSLSPRVIAGFRSLDGFEKELRDTLAAGEDPAAVALRGEDRLHRGETQAGLADLRAAVAAADLPRAKRLLVEALLEGFRSDFAAYRKYESDLLEIADDPRQRSEFLRLLADGLERAGERRTAFEAYLRLSDGGLAAGELEPLGGGLSVRPDRRLRLRIADLYAGAAPDDRSAMDALLAERLTALREAGDAASLERFAALFRDTPAAADALRTLAAHYRSVGDRLREELAELRRRERLDPQEASPDATADAAAGVAADPLAQRFDVTYRAEYVPDEIRSGRPATQVEGGFAVPAVGPLPVGLADWRFELDAQRRHLQARDPYGRVRWKLDVRPPAERDGPLRNIASAQVRACGHLLAFAAGTTLVVIDLSRPGEPRALWSRDLLDRRFVDFAINRRILGEPRLGTPGLIGFAGAEALLYQSGSTVTAADPVTGETLWQRTGVPFGCELSGDDEFVVIQPPGGVEAFVGRIADGGEAAFRRTADHQQRLAWHGTRLVSWTATADGTRLACRDVAREADLWSYDFPNGTKLSTAPPGEAAVLDPKTGRLRVVRFEDGRTLLDAEIDADPSVERIQLLRSFGRTLLLTRRAGRTNVERNAGLFESNGLAYAFDGAGRRLWSAAVTGLNVPLEQPAGLPVLYLAATIHAPDRPPSHRAAVLDVRTGRLLVDQKRERQLLPFEFRTDAGTGSVTIAVPDGRFVLTPADEPLPTPRAEGPGDLPKAAPAATPAAPVPAP